MSFQITQTGFYRQRDGFKCEVQFLCDRFAFGFVGARPAVWDLVGTCKLLMQAEYTPSDNDIVSVWTVEPKFKVGELVLVNFTASDLHQHYGTVDAVEESGVVAVMFFGMDRPLGFLQDNLVPITLPAPLPDGFRLKPRNVEGADGDAGCSKGHGHWISRVGGTWVGFSAEVLDLRYPGSAPYFFAEPIPKPADNRPDPGEGWRLLEDGEVIREGDETGILCGTIVGWVRCGYSVGKTVREDRQSQGPAYCDRAFYRRRIETWTPTARFQDRVLNRDAGGPIPDGALEKFVRGERKLVVREQCWVCGDREEWRVPEVRS